METENVFQNSVKVLLIGVSKYKEDAQINAIPNVKRNIALLKKVFTDNNVLNITEQNITVSLNETNTDIERTLIQVSRETNPNDTLIVYYAGHGIVSTQDFGLYLTAVNTTHDYLETDGISVKRFREIVENSRASRKIMILDACYSGAIHGLASSASYNEEDENAGTYIMTAVSKHESAIYPVENPNLPTLFTGAFLDVLENGVSNNREFLTIRDIFDEIYTSFRNQGLPLPQQSVFQNADKMIFAQNRVS